MEITSIDCRDYKAEQVIALLFDIHPELQNSRRKRKRVYIGVTNDINRRAREHNISIEEIIFYAQTAANGWPQKWRKSLMNKVLKLAM